MSRFRIIKSVNLGDDGPQIGEIWQRFWMHDYGLKSDHERMTGEEHINLSRDGEYPFFTVPFSAVKLIE